MKIKHTKQLALVFAVGSVVLLFATGFLWYAKFPFDSGDEFGAPHIIFNIVAFTLVAAGIVMTFFNIAEDEPLDPEITIKKKYFWWPVIITLIIILLGCISSPFKTCKELYNKSIDYKNQYQKVEYERVSYFDKMWKTYIQKYEICELNEETFIETTKLIMLGRSDGEKIAWKWVQENQQIPYAEFTKFYSDLSAFVQTQRDGYYKLETTAMEIVRENNTMLDIFPNNLYNKFLKIEHMNFEPGFTSTHTEEVFESGLENEF